VRPADRPRLLALLRRLRMPIAGLTTDAVYRAMAGRAGVDPRVVVVVADDGTDLLGLTLSIVNHRDFWQRFMLRYPHLLVQRLLLRLRRATGAARVSGAHADTTPLKAYVSPPSGRKWGDAAPTLAVNLFIAVAPEARSQGLGGRLYEATFEELARRGVTRFDARIAYDNVPSVKMSHRVGWRIEEQGASFFMSIDLPRPLQPDRHPEAATELRPAHEN
jgi:GNAT superfamily N-acetyltransferase